MKLRLDQLAPHLKQRLAPIYLISGDEILLVNEAVDALRAVARAQGFSERLIFTVDRSFDWGAVADATQTMSLFADKRWVELRIAEGKPGEGAKLIEQFAQQASADTLLVIVSGKLDKAAQNSKWVKAVEQSGVSVTCYPISAADLPAWVTARMRARGLQPNPMAAKLLAERVEGNLLAAMQEIEKLAITHQGAVDEKMIVDAVAESARYDVFGLADALLGGDTARVLRMLDGLRETGTEPPLVLWACTRELRILARCAALPAAQRDHALEEMHVWQSRWALYRKACARHTLNEWRGLLQRAESVDCSIKGLAAGSPWDGLIELALGIAGRAMFPVPLH
ncbi:MAG: DNA polymerase III subunit delta [Gammaproteobacteria bacterium]|nr:DNA polymerase III subunit delta [Gammaproteobacteria bacterium]